VLKKVAVPRDSIAGELAWKFICSWLGALNHSWHCPKAYLKIVLALEDMVSVVLNGLLSRVPVDILVE
jgi:hypothetical protein